RWFWALGFRPGAEIYDEGYPISYAATMISHQAIGEGTLADFSHWSWQRLRSGHLNRAGDALNDGTSAKNWREMTPDEIRCQFDMRVAVPTGQDFVARYGARSEAARRRLKAVRDLRYGLGQRQLLDIFPAAQPNAPLAMFWHGGGWRYQSKDHFSYVAEPLVAAGVTTVLVGYDLH